MNEDSTPPAYYPLLLNLAGKHCLVVGGGEVALRKVEGLLEADALVTVIAPRITSVLPVAVAVKQREFQPDDLDGVWLAFAATDNPTVNALVAREGERRRLWVNVVDDPAQCSMILPAVLKRGALRIAVSTAGASPTLARQIRRDLAHHYGPEYGELVELFWHLRRKFASDLNASQLPHPARRHLWESVLRLPLLALLRAGELKRATDLAEDLIRQVVSDRQ